jgi:glycosyltransferase involved in cell wall biosynthesis
LNFIDNSRLKAVDYPKRDCRGAMSLSVIICTYNGASRIQPTLQALANCEAVFPVEIIVVDNNCTDGTADVAAKVWAENGNSAYVFRIVCEPQPGLGFARRAGVLAAHGDIIVFCDDDNWLASDYLTIAFDIMRDERVGAAGGQSDPVTEGRAPAFLYSHGAAYALGVQALESGDVTARGYLWGAGLIVRRSDMSALYGCPNFPALSGRAGVQLTSGEDVEICAALILLGKRLWYDSQLRLEHWIAPDRLTLEYVAQLHSGFTLSGQQVRYYHFMKQLRFQSAVVCLTINALRYLYSPHNSDAIAGLRFIFLSTFRFRALMTEVERQFYDVYRYLAIKACVNKQSTMVSNSTADRPVSWTTAG